MRKKALIVLGSSILIIILVLAVHFSYLNLLKWKYDATHRNNTVNTEIAIDSIFKNFLTIQFHDLPSSYKETTGSHKSPYKKLFNTKKYYAFTRDNLMQKVVKDYRLCDFVSHDAYFYSVIRNNETYYSPLNPAILKTFLQLLHKCEKAGFNTEAIKLRSGHRHPNRNYLIGGASQSRHLFGDAIDIGVYDLNNDGKANDKDKQLIIRVLEKYIIGNSGGIGLYPGTKAVHFDLRGHRARWNTYTPAYKKKINVP